MLGNHVERRLGASEHEACRIGRKGGFHHLGILVKVLQRTAPRARCKPEGDRTGGPKTR